jgi:hypothetical protein
MWAPPPILQVLNSLKSSRGKWWKRRCPPPPVDCAWPSITNNPKEFIACCKNLLSLRSFFNYGGEHCPSATPWKADGSFNIEFVEECTKAVAKSLKDSVNRGEGTDGWATPKFVDMLHLPDHMSRLGATGRFHVGFAERGLKNWAKKPARTAQKVVVEFSKASVLCASGKGQ